jgi:serine/threonine protein kinase
MSIATEAKRCPKCGEPIPAEAPQGLCPKCLLAQASIPTEFGAGARPKSIPPPRDVLAAAFPQLEILELIGQGGMGFVFKARQTKLDRLVALKILPQSLAADPAFEERFAREGRMLARLNHPNIVTIHDFGQAGGFFYLLMEFVDGVNLRQAMKVGRFTPGQALAVVPKICEALQFAHNEGILHRDIKPENVLLDSKGRVKIADFGIAKLLGETRTEGTLTASGATLGTPHYMAPEQLEHPQDVDQRADIYSLGVVFYEMLTGELPIGRFAAPSQKSGADPRLDDVVLRSLEKERQLRQPSADELKTQVERIANTSPPRSSGQPPQDWKTWSLSEIGGSLGRVTAGVIAGALVIIVILIVCALVLGRQPHSSTHQNADNRADLETVAESKLVIEPPPPFKIYNRQSGQLDWGFKCFIPPNHLASILFVVWSNGIPKIDPVLSAYFKVGKAGGIDLSFCSISCYRLADSHELTDARLAKLTNTPFWQGAARWGFPVSPTNVVQWNINWSQGGTGSSLRAMPSFHVVEPALPQSVRSGYQCVVPLVDFDRPEGEGDHERSGVELRIFLEPLRLPAIRLTSNEYDMTNYIGGTGLVGTMDEALKAIKTLPTEP